MYLYSHPISINASVATGPQKTCLPPPITAAQYPPVSHTTLSVLLYFCTRFALSISFNDTPPLADSLNSYHCLSKLSTLEVLS